MVDAGETMSQRAPRFAGEYHGQCQACDAHGSFAFGFAEDREPRAITWDGPACISVDIRNLSLIRQVDDDLWMSMEYRCRGCGAWNSVKVEARVEP